MLAFEGRGLWEPPPYRREAHPPPGLPFTSCTHRINTVDCQTSGQTGRHARLRLRPDGGERNRHLNFSQMLHLMPVGPGEFHLQNDVFRLKYD
ncbi:hypothetical protein ABZP36_035376 [Zizania latifolia]